MSANEKCTYVLADNKLALYAGWDEDLLAAELGALMSAELDFDVSITGFSILEIGGVLEVVAPEEPGDPEDDNLPYEAPVRVGLGHICSATPSLTWLLETARAVSPASRFFPASRNSLDEL